MNPLSWVLFLLAVVTLVNLFGKEHAYRWWPALPFSGQRVLGCPMRCESEPCPCESFCGPDYVPFRVLEDDTLYAMHQRLEADALYCLPKGVGACDQKTSFQVLSEKGWTCHPKAASKACQSDEAENNLLNVLWDRKEHKQANGENLYERHLGRYRYECQCGSLSLEGVKMVSVLPFTCSVDYCLRDLSSHPEEAGATGWDGEKCVCGTFDHADPHDPRSPCVKERHAFREPLYTGRVPCMNEHSFVRRTLFCPPGVDRVMGFAKMVSSDLNTQVVVDRMKQRMRKRTSPVLVGPTVPVP